MNTTRFTLYTYWDWLNLSFCSFNYGLNKWLDSGNIEFCQLTDQIK